MPSHIFTADRKQGSQGSWGLRAGRLVSVCFHLASRILFQAYLIIVELESTWPPRSLPLISPWFWCPPKQRRDALQRGKNKQSRLAGMKEGSPGPRLPYSHNAGGSWYSVNPSHSFHPIPIFCYSQLCPVASKSRTT